MAKMIARKQFRYDGKYLKSGDSFQTLKKQDTRILLASRLAKKDSPKPIIEPEQNEEYLEQFNASDKLELPNYEKPKRRYRRRDMQAE